MSLFDGLFGGRFQPPAPDEPLISDAQAQCGLATEAQIGLSLRSF
ncbi:hypothetical protein [Pseudomonas cremoricolorata]|nr:hypothetical protein [Pseudomonas cremoricolorata]